MSSEICEMLHVWKASGEELAVVKLEDFREVRDLKRHLQGLCGLPRFRQRLVSKSLGILEDDDTLDSPMDLQLVLLDFASASQEQVDTVISAAKAGHVSMMEKLLQRPQNPDSRGYHGKLTPLCEAAFAGHIEAAQLLLEASADKEKRDGRGRTPLQWAAEAGQREMVKLLLQAGADKDKSPGLPVPGTGTPLQVVCSTGDVEIARLLIEAGADKEKVSRPAPNTPLQIACSKGYEDLVKLLLEARADADRALPLMDGGTLLESQGTPLQTACREGHVAIVRMLLEAGASRNKVSRSCLEKPLQLAFASRHLDIARLVSKG